MSSIRHIGDQFLSVVLHLTCIPSIYCSKKGDLLRDCRVVLPLENIEKGGGGVEGAQEIMVMIYSPSYSHGTFFCWNAAAKEAIFNAMLLSTVGGPRSLRRDLQEKSHRLRLNDALPHTRTNTLTRTQFPLTSVKEGGIVRVK